MASFDPENNSGRLGQVLPALLRPIVRLLIARGVTFPSLQKLLKRLYVESVDEDFRIGSEPPTDSRVSLLTGVHRKDVREIRSGAPTTDTARQSTTLLATVVGRWLADPDMVDSQGAPRPLPRQAESGASFTDLVRSVSRDLRPRTVLDELIRLRLVTETQDGMLTLRPDATVGPADPEDKLVFFADNLGDHLTAAAANLDRAAPPYLERAVFYNRLTPESIAEIETEARILAQEVLVRVNALAAERQAMEASDPEARERFRLGVFFFHSDIKPTLTPDEAEI